MDHSLAPGSIDRMMEAPVPGTVHPTGSGQDNSNSMGGRVPPSVNVTDRRVQYDYSQLIIFGQLSRGGGPTFDDSTLAGGGPSSFPKHCPLGRHQPGGNVSVVTSISCSGIIGIGATMSFGHHNMNQWSADQLYDMLVLRYWDDAVTSS